MKNNKLTITDIDNILKASKGKLRLTADGDGYRIGKKPGVTRKQYKTDPRFERSRENNEMFSRATKAAQMIKKAFDSKELGFSGADAHSRLTKLFYQILREDPAHKRGEGGYLTGPLEILQSFSFRKSCPLEKLFYGEIKITANATTRDCHIDFPALIPREAVLGPDGATHFRILATAVSPDFEDGTINRETFLSSHIPLNTQEKHNLRFTFKTPPSQNPTVIAIGLQYYLHEAHHQYLLKNSNFKPLTIVKLLTP